MRLLSPAEVVAKEKEILLAQMANDPKNANKPDAVKQKMIEGKIKKVLQGELPGRSGVRQGRRHDRRSVHCQGRKGPGRRDQGIKFTHFVKGEGLEKRSDDFAAEVASMVK